MLPNPLQHVHKICIGIQSVQAAGGDQALDDADVLGTEFGLTEVPILPFTEIFGDYILDKPNR